MIYEVLFKLEIRYGERYLINFTDDFNIVTVIQRHESFEMFKLFQCEVGNPLNETMENPSLINFGVMLIGTHILNMYRTKRVDKIY